MFSSISNQYKLILLQNGQYLKVNQITNYKIVYLCKQKQLSQVLPSPAVASNSPENTDKALKGPKNYYKYQSLHIYI